VFFQLVTPMRSATLLLCLLVGAVFATVHFEEHFKEGWKNRWTESTSKVKDGTQGKWELSAGDWYNDAEADKGLKTTEDARFYGISAGFPRFTNRGKDLIVQYTVKNTQKIDCGGGYLKIGPGGAPGEAFHGETPYNIMFGPDVCGATKRVHVIFNYKGTNHLIKKQIAPKDDQLTHVYTLHVRSDNTYDVSIDGVSVQSGKLVEDWDFLPAKEIKDPSKSKPFDWVDEAEIDDPTDKKPANYDNIPATIRDPEARKPEDWDDALDGEWEAPEIPNPEYKGPWRPRRIPNPAYKGSWVHPVIPNPAYHEDNHIYAYDDHSWVGFDLWQVKSGTVFDNVLLTDDAQLAKDQAKQLLEKTFPGEKKMFEEKEAEKKKADEAKAHEAAADGDDHDDHDDHEDL